MVFFSVRNKFSIPPPVELQFFDESETVVDEDVFHDLIEANPNICLLAKDFEGTLSLYFLIVIIWVLQKYRLIHLCVAYI